MQSEQGLIQEAEAIIQSVNIPSSPQILIDINKEVLTPEPSFYKIKNLVSMDVSLSAKIVKVANSPFFGLRYPVQSIEHALSILGLENFTNIVLASALRSAFSQDRELNADYEEVLDHSIQVAQISQMILKKAKYLSGGLIFPNQVYMSGLFHDIGILILRMKYPDYFNIVKSHFSGNKNLIEIEEDHFKTNHSVIGYFVAKSWSLPDIVCKVIQYHHHPDFDTIEDVTLSKMLAMNVLAEVLLEYIGDSEHNISSPYTHSVDSINFFNQLLDELNVERDDLTDVLDKIKEMFDSKE